MHPMERDAMIRPGGHCPLLLAALLVAIREVLSSQEALGMQPETAAGRLLLLLACPSAEVHQGPGDLMGGKEGLQGPHSPELPCLPALGAK